MSDAAIIVDRLSGLDRPWFDPTAALDRVRSALASGHTREAWKYTPIKAFVEAFAAADPRTPLEIADVGHSGVRATAFAALDDADLQLVRGCLQRIDGTRYPMADLTMLDASDGLLIRVDSSGQTSLSLRFAETGTQPVIIDVAPGASLNIVEESTCPSFNSQLIYVRVAAGARVNHARTALQAAAMQWSLLMAELEQDSSYELQQFQVGGRRRRTDCHFMLAGTGAKAELTGAYLTEDRGHLDQHLIIEHKARNTVSRQKFHGIGAGRSRSIFNGRIHIHPGAAASDALLTNRNLSLNPGAEIDTKPELEIYTDDVRCAHGATVGQLSEESLFYLRSRGINEGTARMLLCGGFLRECISGPLGEQAKQRLIGALQ